MDEVERIAASDASVKGIWCVPKYSNPARRYLLRRGYGAPAGLPWTCAADDFRIFWDNAYCVHHLYDDPAEQDQLLDIRGMACAEAGNRRPRASQFASTSKITFPGAGISGFAASSASGACRVRASALKAGLSAHDKLNQLRHVRFLPTLDAVRQHMKKHAEFLRPRFECVEEKLAEGLGGTGCATWTHPRGGYFVSFDGPEGSAKRVGALCAEMGVKLTTVGATWPYGEDPHDTNIRIAPSYPTVEELLCRP